MIADLTISATGIVAEIQNAEEYGGREAEEREGDDAERDPLASLWIGG